MNANQALYYSKVLTRTVQRGEYVEHLSCGHTLRIPSDRHKNPRRVCPECARHFVSKRRENEHRDATGMGCVGCGTPVKGDPVARTLTVAVCCLFEPKPLDDGFECLWCGARLTETTCFCDHHCRTSFVEDFYG